MIVKSKQFCVEVNSALAMFGTPASKLSCEMISYSMPTYSALVAIMNHIYYRRGMKWVIDACRVMNKIEYESRTIKTPGYKECYKKSCRRMFEYSFLCNPRYQIYAHYELDVTNFGMEDSCCAFVHDEGIETAIRMGGERVISLGKGNAGIAFVKEAVWLSGEGYYDGSGSYEKIPMFYEFKFKQVKRRRYITHIGTTLQGMQDGIIEFNEKTPKVYERV